MRDGARDPFGLCGQIIDGRYRVQRLVGQGGFGAVYRALHLGFDGAVALKVLKLPKDADDATRDAMTASFKHEGKILFELCSLHHSIVQVTDAGVVVLEGRGPVPYLVLEWLDGIGLNAALDHRRRSGAGPMSFLSAYRVLHPVAEALGAAHRKGIAHRDIKPANIFLARSGGLVVPKLLDFGIAKVVRDLGTTTEMFQATAHAAPFTALYAAPEQWVRRLGATGTWTDVYAFALVMSELLTGQPSGGDGDALQAMGIALDMASRPTPRAHGADVSESVEEVFRRAMSVEPRARIRSLAEFWTSLAQAAGIDPDAPPAPLRSDDWHLPEPEEAVHGTSSERPPASRRGPTLPTEDGTDTSSRPAPATGGPVVSATPPEAGSLPASRRWVSAALAAVSTAVAFGIAGWLGSTSVERTPQVPDAPANPSAWADPVQSVLVDSAAPTALTPAATPDISTSRPSDSLSRVRPPGTGRDRKHSSQAAASERSHHPPPPNAEPSDPTPEEILKNRR